jgi:hypothetical protein
MTYREHPSKAVRLAAGVGYPRAAAQDCTLCGWPCRKGRMSGKACSASGPRRPRLSESPSSHTTSTLATLSEWLGRPKDRPSCPGWSPRAATSNHTFRAWFDRGDQVAHSCTHGASSVAEDRPLLVRLVGCRHGSGFNLVGKSRSGPMPKQHSSAVKLPGHEDIDARAKRHSFERTNIWYS